MWLIAKNKNQNVKKNFFFKFVEGSFIIIHCLNFFLWLAKSLKLNYANYFRFTKLAYNFTITTNSLTIAPKVIKFESSCE